MIQILRQPLQHQQAKEIRDWLNLPAAFAFQRYIAETAMSFTAEAGNALLQDAPGLKEESEDKARLAKMYREFNAIIAQMRHTEFGYAKTTIQPETIVTTEK